MSGRRGTKKREKQSDKQDCRKQGRRKTGLSDLDFAIIKVSKEANQSSPNDRRRMMMSVEIRYIRGHVEVFDQFGDFMFSADTTSEAWEELREWEEDAA